MRWKHRPVPSTLSRKVGLMDEWFIAQLLDIKTFTLCAIEQHIIATTLTLNFRLTHVAIAFDDTFSSDPIPTSVNGERSFVRAGQTQPCIQAITFSSPFPLHLALHRMQFAKRKRKKFLAKMHKGIYEGGGRRVFKMYNPAMQMIWIGPPMWERRERIEEQQTHHAWVPVATYSFHTRPTSNWMLIKLLNDTFQGRD